MTILVKDIMSSPVVSLFGEQTMPLAEDIMAFRHVRHLPVVDDRNCLLGVVTHRDILRAQVSSLVGLTVEQRRTRQAAVRAADIMTETVWTVKPDMTAASAARLLLEHRFGCLPVVTTTGELVGIVTERDFLKLASETLDAGVDVG
jgi:CBS domain-containing membrane protein